MNRLLSLIAAILAAILAVVCLGIGVFFIYQGVSKNNYIVDNLRQEKITLGLTQAQISSGEVVDNAARVQAASEKVRSDRRNIAPTYGDLLKGGRFDPTNPTDLTYAQAMNLENSLNTTLLAFGTVQIAEGAGAFMILVGLALITISIVLWRLSGRREIIS
jgi:hypothetical protein